MRRRTLISVAAAMVGAAAATAACGVGTAGPGTVEPATKATIYDDSRLHSVSVTADAAALQQLMATYATSRSKEWLRVTVEIDGQRFEQVGLRLKGNSSLMRTSSSSNPTTLPWLIKLDKYLPQDIGGFTNFVIRSNNTATALNEAVALDLLGHAGLPTSHAVATRFSMNGGAAALRLLVQDLDGEWEDENFTTEGALFKAESGGDWTYRGDDPAAYEEVFDQETNEKLTDLTPLIQLLQFLNQSDDATFAAGLPKRVDTAAFARYLAFEALVGNVDDIDGPGNNSFQRWDAGTGVFTIVAWDHNLAFGGMGQFGGGPGGGMPNGGPPGGAPSGGPGGVPSGGGNGGNGRNGGNQPGRGGRSNILVQRFTANADHAAAVEKASTELKQTLFTSGLAGQILDRWAALLRDRAGDLVATATIDKEAAAIRDRIA